MRPKLRGFDVLVGWRDALTEVHAHEKHSTICRVQAFTAAQAIQTAISQAVPPGWLGAEIGSVSLLSTVEPGELREIDAS